MFCSFLSTKSLHLDTFRHGESVNQICITCRTIFILYIFLWVCYTLVVDVILDRNYELSYVPAFQTTYHVAKVYSHTHLYRYESHQLGPIRVDGFSLFIGLYVPRYPSDGICGVIINSSVYGFRC